MVQYGIVDLQNIPITKGYALSGSNDYYNSIDITFPEQFKSIMSIVCTVNSPNHLVNVAMRNRTNQICGCFVFCSTPVTISIEVHYIAIGRWK